MATVAAALTFATLTPYFGAVIDGTPLRTVLNDPTLFSELKSLITSHRLVVFRGSGPVTAEEQIELSRRLGKIESTFYKHPQSPHPDIFRVSNEDKVGCTNVGRSGWHSDGTFLKTPFSFQTMYFPKVSRSGFTQFIPLSDFFNAQPLEVQERWRRLVFVVASAPNVGHRLVYPHPRTNRTTMLFHLGKPFCGGWLLEPERDQRDTKEEEGKQNSLRGCEGEAKECSPSSLLSSSHRSALLLADPSRSNSFVNPQLLHTEHGFQYLRPEIVIQELNIALEKQGAFRIPPLPSASSPKTEGEQKSPENPPTQQLVHTMRWEEHDFAIVDNLALAHYATEGTQLRAEEDGLRVLHRTTVL